MVAFLDYYVQYPPETWTGAGAVVLDSIFSALDRNPFHPFEEMRFNDRDEWLPYDRAQALAYLKRGSRTVGHYRMRHPFSVQGGIAQFGDLNSVTFSLSEHYLDDRGIQAAGAFLLHLVAPLAHPRWGWCKVDRHVTHIADFYADRKLRTLPECFGAYLGWRHVLSPAGYAPYFERDTLLQTPAWRVHEDEQGLIELVMYADPLSYNTAQTQQHIIDITTYLNTHCKP